MSRYWGALNSAIFLVAVNLGAASAQTSDTPQNQSSSAGTAKPEVLQTKDAPKMNAEEAQAAPQKVKSTLIAARVETLGSVEVDIMNYKADLRISLAKDGSKIEKFIFIDAKGKGDIFTPAQVREGADALELAGQRILQVRSAKLDERTGGIVEFVFVKNIPSQDVRSLKVKLKRQVDGTYGLFTNDAKPEVRFNRLKLVTEQIFGVPVGVVQIAQSLATQTLRATMTETLPKSQFSQTRKTNVGE